jgi:hypothetical protein
MQRIAGTGGLVLLLFSLLVACADDDAGQDPNGDSSRCRPTIRFIADFENEVGAAYQVVAGLRPI